MWWSTSCERGWDGWYNIWWSNIWWSKSRMFDYGTGIDDIMCDDITCDLHLAGVARMDDITCKDIIYYDLNLECEITGLELMI